MAETAINTERLDTLENYARRAVSECQENTTLKKLTNAMIMVEAAEIVELIEEYRRLAGEAPPKD